MDVDGQNAAQGSKVKALSTGVSSGRMDAIHPKPDVILRLDFQL